MGPLPLKIVGPCSCAGSVHASCAECEAVLVACTTDAAPILKEWVYTHGGAYDVHVRLTEVIYFQSVAAMRLQSHPHALAAKKNKISF